MLGKILFTFLTATAFLVSVHTSVPGNLQNILVNSSPLQLPGGRSLPGIPFGNLSGLRLDDGSTVYSDGKFFGVFVSSHYATNIPSDNIITFRSFLKGQRVGTVSLVGADQSGKNSGLLLLLDTHNLSNINPSLRLPGGRSLPGVPFGNLPGVLLDDGTTVYLDDKFFGVFISSHHTTRTTNILSNNIVTFRSYRKGQRVGTVSFVGADENGKNSGLLILLDADKIEGSL